MLRRLLVLTLAACALSAPAAHAAVEARLDRPSPVAAYGGRLAWSTYDAATKKYVLTTRAGGVTSAVPVAPRGVPFDVDLGPQADGTVAATYSRCRTEAPPAERASGCDVYLYDFSTGVEQRVTHASAPDANESWPTLWRGRLAFARDYDGKPGLGYLYTRTLASGAPSTRQPGGPRSRCDSCHPTPASRAVGLDLYGTRLGFAWLFLAGGEGLDSDIRLDTIGGGHQRIAHQHGGGLTQVQLGWPAFEAGRLYWSVSCVGDPGGCPGRFGLRRMRYAGSGDAVERAAGPAAVQSHDRDGGQTYLLTDAQAGAECMGDPPVPGGTCTLTSSSPVFATP